MNGLPIEILTKRWECLDVGQLVMTDNSDHLEVDDTCTTNSDNNNGSINLKQNADKSKYDEISVKETLETILNTIEKCDGASSAANQINTKKANDNNDNVNDNDDNNNNNNSKFHIDEEINKKMWLWCGEIWKLSVDAIVLNSNETLTDRSDIAEEVFRVGGEEEIAAELKLISKVKTGYACITSAGYLPCKRILHGVSPKWSKKHANTAESALHHCYRNCALIARHENIKSIAFSCLNVPRKNYPREGAAHVALRTLRRFIEQNMHLFDEVIFCVQKKEDLRAYSKLMPIFFPRNQEEEKASIAALANGRYDENGDRIFDERRIKIMEDLSSVANSTLNQYQPTSTQFCDDSFKSSDAASYVQYVEDDLDTRRKYELEAQKKNMSKEEKKELRLKMLQREAVLDDLSDIATERIIYPVGYDQHGRQIILLLGKFLETGNFKIERVLSYIVKVLKKIRTQRFHLVYFHTETLINGNELQFLSWIKEIMSLLSLQYEEKLVSLHIIHPTLKLKMALWAMNGLSLCSLRSKIIYSNNLDDLFRYLPWDQIPLQEYIINHDKIVSEQFKKKDNNKKTIKRNVSKQNGSHPEDIIVDVDRFI